MFGPREIGERTDDFVNLLMHTIGTKKPRLPITSQLFWFTGSLVAVTAVRNRDPDAVPGRPGLSLIYGVFISPEAIRYGVLAGSFQVIHSYLRDEFQTPVSIPGADSIISKCQSELPIEELVTTEKIYRVIESFEHSYGLRAVNPWGKAVGAPILRLRLYRVLRGKGAPIQSFGDFGKMLVFWKTLDDSIVPDKAPDAAMQEPIDRALRGARMDLLLSVLTTLLLNVCAVALDALIERVEATRTYIVGGSAVLALLALAIAGSSLSTSQSVWKLRKIATRVAADPNMWHRSVANPASIGLVTAHALVALAGLSTAVMVLYRLILAFGLLLH